MAKQTENLYMLEEVYSGKRYVSPYKEHEMSHLSGNVVLLGKVEVEIDYPEIDTRQAAIDALQTAIDKERAESQSRVNLLLERISKLQAIGHDQPAVKECQEGDVF